MPETDAEQTLQNMVKLFQQKMAHAWMVRTFIKHCDEVEDYPELMGIVRAVFDTVSYTHLTLPTIYSV